MARLKSRPDAAFLCSSGPIREFSRRLFSPRGQHKHLVKTPSAAKSRDFVIVDARAEARALQDENIRSL